MYYWLLCGSIFLATYLLNILYITVFYHRALTHKALKLSPLVERFVIHTGSWVTGLDPKGWSCMHRMHHIYSDSKLDPHSPVYGGIFSLFLVQLHSYERTLSGLIRGNPAYTSFVADLTFPVSWLNRRKLWMVPYVTHLCVAIALGFMFHGWAIGVAYWLGMMSHPIQGWMVNALGHSYGYRNFDLEDRSKNNLVVSWLVMGEGYQNNHHQDPSSPNFGVKWWEIDMGYGLCLLLARLGLVTISSAKAEAQSKTESLPISGEATEQIV